MRYCGVTLYIIHDKGKAFGSDAQLNTRLRSGNAHQPEKR